jgi:prepilin-type N-terminal cleavage/methylation domain-containing protein
VSRTLATLLRDPRGFTLTEMLASMAVLGVLFALFASVMTQTITQSTQEQESTVLQTEARAAVERFASELRTAYSGVDGTWPIEAVSATTIRFLSPERLSPFKLQRIEWQLTGGKLQRRYVTTSDTDGDPWVWPSAITSATWITQARSIRNASILQAFDESGAATTTPANVRKVTITLEVSTTGRQSRKSTFQTTVIPRVTPT